MRVWRMRTGIFIALKPAARRRLKALASNRNTPHKHVWRAEIVLLSVERLRGPILKGQPVVTYTAKEGQLVRTCIEVDHEVQWGTGMGAKLELLGDGPTADTARRLGLDTARMVASFRTDGFRAKLPIGRELGPLAR